MSYTNVVVTLALLFAMSGGAFAATHTKFIITSTKQISPAVLKKLKGANGANGTPGAQGSRGENGAAGSVGPAGGNGSNGANGMSVTSKEFSGEKEKCKTGGSEFSSASGKTYACNGTTGFTETLPSGKTETGQWVTAREDTAGDFQRYAFSFPIPLAKTAKAHFINEKEGEGPGETPNAAIVSGECKGTVQKPEAAKGNFCVFAFRMSNATLYSFRDAGSEEESVTGLTGDMIILQTTATEFDGGWGTWAVTAE
jgi:hypothetical protein